MKKFFYGIEHEVAFLKKDNSFVCHSNTKFQELEQIINKLPEYKTDYPQLRIGDAKIKVKRWYVEGYERFSEEGELTDCEPKGIEIRTTIQDSIPKAIKELEQSFLILKKTAISYGLKPILLSFNPNFDTYIPTPKLNEYEIKRRNSSTEKRTAHIPILTYGPDLNISCKDFSTSQIIEAGKKLTYYSPFIVPFSFSSPFKNGEYWNGKSYRTFVRTGDRPAVMVFLEHKKDLIKSVPSLTKIARLPAEIGRIEFKAFDSIKDFKLYGSLLALLKGIILDSTLLGRELTPNKDLHKLSAIQGFTNKEIKLQTQEILIAAQKALTNEKEKQLIDPLFLLLQNLSIENKYENINKTFSKKELENYLY